MRYRSDDPQSVIAMELARTDNYGDGFEEDYTETCPVCGAVSPEHFFMNDDEECVGCYECLHRVYELF